MLFEYHLGTERENMYSVMPQIYDAIEKSGIQTGTVLIYTPHTTSAITINENSDPDVIHDMLLGLNRIYPDLEAYRHFEGNSTAHLKASTFGASETLILENGSLVLGTWQDVYFCEFDGPRKRRFYVRVTE